MDRDQAIHEFDERLRRRNPASVIADYRVICQAFGEHCAITEDEYIAWESQLHHGRDNLVLARYQQTGDGQSVRIEASWMPCVHFLGLTAEAGVNSVDTPQAEWRMRTGSLSLSDLYQLRHMAWIAERVSIGMLDLDPTNSSE